ncbi:MAG: hypothetical protein AAF564_21640 [Bacteroidota bacterium]
MKQYSLSIASVAALVVLLSGCLNQTQPSMHAATATVNLSNVSLPGATVLAFGPEQVLFVGDSKAATVHAIATEGVALEDPVPFNMPGLDRKIASMLGLNVTDILINDMKIHPVSQEAYVAVQRGLQPGAESVIAIVSPASGEIRFLDLTDTDHQTVVLANPASDDVVFWGEKPASTLNITDLDYHQGHLYVAGLTNGEFASTLRKIPYPFDGSQSAVGSIEIYHAVHTQNETRAPIRTMLFDEVDGVPMLLASYTCTPLVTIPVSDVSAGNDVKGKTIAELGFGNAPSDMISFMTQEPDGSFDKKVLITHKQRSGSLISMKDLAAANAGDGLQGTTMGPAGVAIFPVPTSSVMHIDNQNQMMLSVLRRNIDTGGADLISQLKGAYFRLSDFISEYDFPDYAYPEAQAGTKQFHDMVKPLEGYPQLTSGEMNR